MQSVFLLIVFGLFGLFFVLMGVLGLRHDYFYRKYGKKLDCFVEDFETDREDYYSDYTPQKTIAVYYVTLKLPDSDDTITVKTYNYKAKRFNEAKFAEIYYIDDPEVFQKVSKHGEIVEEAKFTFDLKGKAQFIAGMIGAVVFFAVGIWAYFYFL
ncbi:MAG: hypothetical protein LBL87_03360 [Ruminococcus sp.]|jgi:hypothetical protein|nr:hypothetical protein [Ruminococcus sp.]